MKPLLITMSLVLTVASCQRSQHQEGQRPSGIKSLKGEHGPGFEATIAVGFNAAGSSFAGVLASDNRNFSSKSRAALAVLVTLSLYNSADLVSAGAAGKRLHGLVFNLVDSSGNLYYSIKHRDMVRHFRQFEEFYLNQLPYDLVDQEGRIHDHFLRTLVDGAADRASTSEKKLELVRQFLVVLRNSEKTDRAWLDDHAITDPLAIELHRAKSGFREAAETEEEKEAILRDSLRANYAVWGIDSMLVGGVIGSSGKQLDIRIISLVLLASGSGVLTTSLLSGKDPIIDVLEAEERILRLGKGDIYTSFVAYRLHFANLTINDLYDDEGKVTDSFARAFVSGMAGPNVSAEEERDIIRQLLIVAHAEPTDSLEDLRWRGIKDTRFLKIFETWRALRDDINEDVNMGLE